MRTALGIAAVTALIVLCTLLPFLPGAYDPLAVPLSMMARVLGLASLVLVPIGALWIASARSERWAAHQHRFAMAALIASSLIGALLSLAAFALGSPSLAVITAVAGLCAVVAIRPRLRSLKTAAVSRSPVPIYLVVVPVAVLLLQYALIDRAIAFSRDRAIRNSAALIADIEQYRTARGHYPPSLLSENKDYKPSIIGIDRFHYEPSGESYNVIFEQPASAVGTREFVVYNPRDEQEVTGHAMDILQYPPEQLQRARGYYAVHATSHAHWKYFWFD